MISNICTTSTAYFKANILTSETLSVRVNNKQEVCKTRGGCCEKTSRRQICTNRKWSWNALLLNLVEKNKSGPWEVYVSPLFFALFIYLNVYSCVTVWRWSVFELFYSFNTCIRTLNTEVLYRLYHFKQLELKINANLTRKKNVFELLKMYENE